MRKIVGVNSKQEIYIYNGAGWDRIDGSLANISVGGKGAIWGVNAHNAGYVRLGTAENAAGTEWLQVTPENAAHCISVGYPYADVWMVDLAGRIYQRDFSGEDDLVGSGWKQRPGRLDDISVGYSWNVWGVNEDGEIFRFNIDQHPWGWEQIGGRLVHISVGRNGEVWGVNEDGDIYRRLGISDHNQAGTEWERISGNLVRISVGSDEIVFGINKDDNIYARMGISSCNKEGTHWEQVAGKLRIVSVY